MCRAVSDAGLDTPLEGSDAKHGVVCVGFFETLEEGSGLLVLDDGEDSAVHGGPCMAAEMGVAGGGAASACLLKVGVAAHVGTAEDGHYVFGLCLVEGDEYGFHLLSLKFLVKSRESRESLKFKI